MVGVKEEAIMKYLLSVIALTGLLLGCGQQAPPPPKAKPTPPKPSAPTRADVRAAIDEGDVEKLRQVLLTDPKLVKVVVASGDVQPLHYAARLANAQLVSTLLMAGADINARELSGMTPLRIAVRLRRPDNVLLLLQQGATVKAAEEMCTPPLLHDAIRVGLSKEVLAALIKAGADAKAEDDNGQTPLHVAARTGNEEALELLAANGCPLEAADKDNRTALDIAQREKNLTFAGLLAKMIAPRDALTVRTTTENTAPPPPPKTTVTTGAPPPPPPPPKSTVQPNQVMIVIMSFGSVKVPGQRTALVSNTGSTPVKGELVWTSVDASDTIKSGSKKLSLAPLEKINLTIGNAIPVVTNTVTTGTTGYVPPGYGTGYGYSAPRMTVTQPSENKMGFLVEFFADGVLVGSQAQPPDAKQRIRALQGN